MLAVCDALSLVVQEGRNFGPEEFARFHPGGSLGRKLTRVEEIMRQGERNPVLAVGNTVLQAMEVMSRTPGRPGATNVVDGDGRLVGLFTDGDLRRLLMEGRGADLSSLLIEQVMTKNPKTIAPDRLAVEALQVLREHHIDQIPVTDDRRCAVGLVDVQDILDLRIH
jgi:arabinose-5-phosphate isomerase